MKKGLCLILALVLYLSLCACSSDNSSATSDTSDTSSISETIDETSSETADESIESAPASTVEESEPDIPRLNLGETASTNLVDFTLLNADFAIYASNVVDKTYLTPVDESTLYGAKLGKILMIPSFTMTSKDRAGSMSVAGGSGDWEFDWEIGYEGAEYPLFGFDLNFDDLSVGTSPSCIIDPLTKDCLERYTSLNYLLSAGETVSMRIVTVADFEPANLTDGFELHISLPNSSGELEDFIYVIPDADTPSEQNQSE